MSGISVSWGERFLCSTRAFLIQVNRPRRLSRVYETRKHGRSGDGRGMDELREKGRAAGNEFGIRWISCAWTLKATRIEVLP